jgi:peptidyl-prolyl cis-trans isomerase A (cyclophilin A)
VIVRLAATISIALATCLLAGCSSSSSEKKEEAVSTPPAVYKVDFDTSRGPFVVEVHSDWAPYGAARFYELVRKGFYDNNRFFRVVRGFIVQFGINGDPAVNRDWMTSGIPDEGPRQPNERGTIVFAKSQLPNSRTTQLFINLADNAGALDPQGFAPFGKVVSGMDTVDNIYAGYGEMAPNGSGPDPAQIQIEGNTYLTSKFPHLDYIKTATIEK